jgi:hypothetical protein
MIAVCKTWVGSFAKDTADALTELRERREAEKAPCPEHAKMVAEWEK